MPEHHLLDLDSLPSAFEPCPECGDVMCQPDPWGEDCNDRARRRQAVATLEDQRRQAHALAAPAAAARARYKRLARRDEPHPDLVPALEEAIRLSCQRRDLLERIATDSEALARANTAHPEHATLARRAADDRAAVEACHDVDLLRLSR